MIYLTDKEKLILSKVEKKQFIVTYGLGKDIKTQLVFGKSCGVVVLSEDVCIFAVYDEQGIEAFVCDFESFLSVMEKSSGKLRQRKKASLNRLQIVQP
jgi:hypothetical protein